MVMVKEDKKNILLSGIFMKVLLVTTTILGKV